MGGRFDDDGPLFRRRVPGSGVLVVALLAATFTFGSFLAPLLEGQELPGGSLLRSVYAPLCHQQAERSLQLDGQAQAVCARCSGLYLGGVAGLLVGALLVALGRLRPRPAWLAVVALPTAVDATLSWIGFAGLDNVPRLLLAVPVGLVAALFLSAGLEDLFTRDRATEPVETGRSLEVVDG